MQVTIYALQYYFPGMHAFTNAEYVVLYWIQLNLDERISCVSVSFERFVTMPCWVIDWLRFSVLHEHMMQRLIYYLLQIFVNHSHPRISMSIIPYI